MTTGRTPPATPAHPGGLPAWTAISPLDGRYHERLAQLGRYFSEPALMASRCRVELRYLQALDATGCFGPLSVQEHGRIEAALAGFDDDDYARIKELEARSRHDVKACEYFLVERLQLSQPWLVHFGLTSEDINNLAYTLLLAAYRQAEQLPLLDRLIETLRRLALAWADYPFPAHTHGQPASPTTAGKELAVFMTRLARQRDRLRELCFMGKLNGATGTFAALLAARPDHDWLSFSERFVTDLGLVPNPLTTQIEDHDTWAEYFDITRRIAGIVLDLDVDCWEYISRGYFRQSARAGEVGSSTMPHKINPIHFENSEGNCALAQSLLATLAGRLTHSRMQRDLSDSTLERNVGVALAHQHLALIETLAGLERIELDRVACLAELEAHPELLAEPFQVILKQAGVSDAYERLKTVTRGAAVTRDDLLAVLAGLTLPDELRQRLASLCVASYVGDAARLCRRACQAVEPT